MFYYIIYTSGSTKGRWKTCREGTRAQTTRYTAVLASDSRFKRAVRN